MERELEVPGWMGEWLSRDFQPLHCETIVATYAITITALIVSLHQLWSLRRARKDIEQGADRALVLSRSNKSSKKTLQAQRCLSWLLLCHALAIWLVDAGISILAIKSDVAERPSAYNSKTWLNLAIYSLGLFTLFTSVLVLTPTLQFLAVGKLLQYRRPDATTLSTLLPGALTASHQLAYLWLLVGFVMVSWWSVDDYSLLRMVLLEAVFGSGLAWMHVSTMLSRCSDELGQMDVNSFSIRAGVEKLYSTQAEEVALPRYEDEKASLL